MSYRVTLWHDEKGNVRNVNFYMSRKQALYGMRKVAYVKLAAFGKLDTRAAHDVMAAIDRCDDILPPQASHCVPISNTGYSLTMSNTARMPR